MEKNKEIGVMTNQDFEALSMIARIEFPLNHFCKHYSSLLYHYTSRKGLEGILASDKPSLWFSQYDYLNDPTERLDIEIFLKEYCERKLEEGEFSKEFAEMVMSIRGQDECYVVWQNDVDNFNVGDTKECYTYICSFSEDYDSLPMWNYYTKSENQDGYNIMFKPYSFREETGHRNGFKLELNKVIYDDKTKTELADKMLLDFSKSYDNAPLDTKESIRIVLQWLVNKFQFVFKNAAYEYEKEVRAILRVPKDFTEDSFISKRKERKIGNYSIPYVSFNVPEFKHLTITTSPTIQQVDVDLYEKIKNAGYKDVRFINSAIPFRNMF